MIATGAMTLMNESPQGLNTDENSHEPQDDLMEISRGASVAFGLDRTLRVPFPARIHLVVGALLSALFFQIGCSRSTSPFAKSQTISPVEIFQRVSPSVFVVEALDANGKTLMLGSGVAMARDFLITNCHVVQSGSSLRVSRGKEHWTARLIQAVVSHDLCGLRPSGLTLQPVEVRPSSKLATGEHVYAIGSPEGLELTFSEGVISALRETEGVRMIQTSAAISPGSSGGGLFDAQGNLVGVTSFYLKEGQSLNFALSGEWVSGMLSSSTEAAAKSSTRLSDAELESREHG
jgi:S1-C subfamily serine protease